jgi:hypothetical protein
MAKKMESLSDGIRHAIDASELSAYAIAKAAKINESQLSKFRSGKGGMGVDALDRLGQLLKLKIVTVDNVKKGR